MGYEYGDAQNYAVRVFLNQFSKKFKYFDQYYLQKTLQYFNYQCPYTGVNLLHNRYEKEHIIPINRESCGLHVYGNVLLVTREANLKKGNKSIEEFLCNEPEKLQKIKRFINETGYQEIDEHYKKLLKIKSENLYRNIGTIVKKYCEEVDKDCAFDTLISKCENIEQSRKISVQNEQEQRKSLGKDEIINICFKNEINLPKRFTKASKSRSSDFYWANPNISNLTVDWWLILDDYNYKNLYCFKIPAKDIEHKNIKTRNDNNRLIDIQIKYNDKSFTDSRSGIRFEKWLIKSISY